MRGNPRQLKPTRYERDCLIQVWLDRRDIATISRYMSDHGMRHRYLAEILKFAVENIRTIIVNKGGEFVENPQEATMYLETKFNVKLNPNERGKKNFVNNLLVHSYKNGEIDLEHESYSSGYSVNDIEKLKAQAREQFSQQPDLLEETRAEKDEVRERDEADVFASIGKEEL